MEKISRIISSSPRVSSVDLKNSLPVRPGVPSFGRPQGEVTKVNIDGRTTAEKAVAEHLRLQDKRRGEEFHSEVARDLTNKFFMQKSMDANPLGAQPMPQETLNPVPGDSVGPSSNAIDPDVNPLEDLHFNPQSLDAAENMDAPEIGRYLDVHA